MSRAVGKYLQAIRDQRLILDEYRDFEADIEMFALTMAAVNGNTHVAAFGSQIADYHHNLDAAAQRIKHALDIGGEEALPRSGRADARVDRPQGRQLRNLPPLGSGGR